MALLGIYMLFYYDVALALENLNHNWTHSTGVLIAFNAGNIPGRFLPLIPERSLKPGSITTLCTFSGAVLLYIGTTTSFPGTVTVTTIYGMVVGGIQATYSTVVAAQSGGCNKRISAIFWVSGLGCLFGPPIGGGLIDGKGGYLGMQLFAATAVLIGGMGFGLSIWTGKRNVGITV